MADKERLIDAKLLTTNIAQIAKNCAKSDAQKALIGRILFMIDNMPTLEVLPDNGWISVKDRLPEYDKTVLVVNEDGYMHTAVRIKGSIARIDEWQIKFGVCFTDNDVWEEDEQGKITHWQYLPEPPKGE